MAGSIRNKGKRSLAKENADPVAIMHRLVAGKHLGLSLNKKSKSIPLEWYLFIVSEQFEALKKAIVPKSTKKCTYWSGMCIQTMANPEKPTLR